ncbi:MAG: hypothetical protein V1746_03270 [bacterium]
MSDPNLPTPPRVFTPPKPKPVPANADKPAPAADINAERLKVKKVEVNQPRQRRKQQVPFKPVFSTTRPESPLEKKAGLWKKLSGFKKTPWLLACATIIVAGGAFLLLGFRETRLQIIIQPGDLQLQPEASIVLDFSERMEFVKKSLRARLEPIRASLADTNAKLNAAQADLAGRKEAQRLLQGSMQQEREKTEALMKDTTTKLSNLWDEESQKLNEAYEAAKREFNGKIEARAKSLGVEFKPNAELDMPEVSVNAFRLALYDAPKGVDVNAERIWAEDELQNWRKFEDEQKEKRLSIKSQAQGLRAPLGGEVEKFQDRFKNMTSEIESTNQGIERIQEEIATLQEEEATLKKNIEETFHPFYEEFLRIPHDYTVLTYPVPEGGFVDMRDLEKRKELQKGRLCLLLRATKGGEEFWFLQDLHLKKFQTTRINVNQGQFIPAHSLLE